MRKTDKQALFLLLAVVLALGMLPGAAWAADTSGTCGDNLTWTLDNGVLTISGTGEMRNYLSSSSVPWKGQRTAITSVVINDGVTNVGSFTFYECTKLTSATIPNSVTNIGGSAFAQCTGLTSVTIPSSVTDIGPNAFYDTPWQKSQGEFVICNGILIAYQGKSSNVTIPNGVTSIGHYVFKGPTSVVIPNSVTSIRSKAFYYCTSLTSVTIPNSVANIESEAFSGCTGLTSITIPKGVTNIAESAFSGCASLTNVTIPDSVISIEKSAFQNCRGLTSVTIPNSVTNIEYDSFNGCTSLKSVMIGSRVASIGDRAFADCTGLASVFIPSSAINIGPNAFLNCTGLTDVYYAGTMQQWDAIEGKSGKYTFRDDLANAVIHFEQSGLGQTDPAPSPGNDADPYNLGDETYSFENYGDSDSTGGHCFGMSMTSAGYHNNLLDIGNIGGNANTPLYSFSRTQTVKRPICHYQGIQGSYSARAIVAGGSSYLNDRSDIVSDWQEVVRYVRNHNYDDTGLLQIGFRKDNEGGHAINFLRYENVNGQDRIYAYDNNFPTQETYFYRDASGNVRQAPVQTFSGAIDCIALRDCRTYFNNIGDFDATHVLYMAKDSAAVEGYPYSYMEAGFSDKEYVMYEIPADVEQVTIIPGKDNATFIYMDKEYSFGKITDETRGEFRLVSVDKGIADTDASFRVYEDDPVISIHFSDVPTDSWYYAAVQWAVEQGITNGTGVNPATFSPMRECKQVEILTFLWRAAGEPSSSAALPFTPQNGYAEGALRWAYEKGMIGANFDEDAPCTRATAVKFIWQAKDSPAASGSTFSDVPAGADYAQAVAWAVEKGVTNGTGTNPPTFSPDNTCTRGQIVTFLYRAWGN